jgi:hypothetical protein
MHKNGLLNMLKTFRTPVCDCCISFYSLALLLSKKIFIHFFLPFNIEASCVQGLHLWRDSSSVINDELYQGYRKGNSEGKINEIVAGSST